MSKKSRQRYSKILKRRKQKIKRRLKRKQWEDQERPMFKGGNIYYEVAEKSQAINCGGYRSNPSDGAEVWTGGGNKCEVNPTFAIRDEKRLFLGKNRPETLDFKVGGYLKWAVVPTYPIDACTEN